MIEIRSKDEWLRELARLRHELTNIKRQRDRDAEALRRAEAAAENARSRLESTEGEIVAKYDDILNVLAHGESRGWSEKY